MATFPDEIIIEILTRVPAKSLIRFRCVCKPWCSLISESRLIQLHFKRAVERDDLSLFINCTTDVDEQWGEQSEQSITKYCSHMYCLDFNSSNEAVEIVYKESFLDALLDQIILGSCNGLVCLYTMGAFCILNPLTREFKLVDHECGYGCFEYEDGSVFGFGYDGNADVYSALHIFLDDNSYHFKAHIYSFSDNSTDVVTIDAPYEFKCDSFSGIYLNGALHWGAFSNPIDKRNETIVSFNMSEKVFQELPRPDKLSENTCITVGLLRGKLSIHCFFPGDPIEIWIMNNYGVRDSWYKLCSIEHTVIPFYHALGTDSNNDTGLNARPLCISKNGEIMVMVGGDIVLYDSRQNQARNLDIHGMTNQNKLHEDKVTYISSLVSFK